MAQAWGFSSSRTGLLVGKQGSTIKNLQQENNVLLSLNSTPTTSQDVATVTVEGSPTAVKKCLEQMAKIIGMELVENGKALERMVVEIPSGRIGKVVGKGGAEKQRLEAESGCALTLPEKSGKASNTTQVILEGPNTKLLHQKLESHLQQSIPIISTTATQIPSPSIVLPPKQNYAAHFTPNIVAPLVTILSSATKTLDICVFTLTFDTIARAVCGAAKRGVTVRFITDKSQANVQGSDIDTVREAGCQVKLFPKSSSAEGALMHHKFCVADHVVVVSGSFNWTKNAGEANCENIVVTTNKEFVNQFSQHFEKMWSS